MYGFFGQSNFCLAVSLGVKLQTLNGTVDPVSVLFAALAICSADRDNCVQLLLITWILTCLKALRHSNKRLDSKLETQSPLLILLSFFFLFCRAFPHWEVNAQ